MRLITCGGRSPRIRCRCDSSTADHSMRDRLVARSIINRCGDRAHSSHLDWNPCAHAFQRFASDPSPTDCAQDLAELEGGGRSALRHSASGGRGDEAIACIGGRSLNPHFNSWKRIANDQERLPSVEKYFPDCDRGKPEYLARRKPRDALNRTLLSEFILTGSFNAPRYGRGRCASARGSCTYRV